VEVARRLAAYHDASDLPLLFGACDQLLAAHDPAALDVWLLTGESAPSGIFNGDFAKAPLNHGFDWRLIESTGVTHVNLDPGHRISFSGRQPESCALLRQTVMLVAGKQYRLQWEARTAGIKSPSGLLWQGMAPPHPISPSAEWTAGETIFTAPENFNLLELSYQRPVGESRAEGSVELRRVRLTEVAK
jgi:hypothetical protein